MNQIMFHTQEDRGYVLTKPILCSRKNAWLGTAYYFWAEEDMIRSHMFPINPSVPKYAESWIVSMVDKAVAAEELSLKFKIKIKYAYSLLMLFMFNFIR